MPIKTKSIKQASGGKIEIASEAELRRLTQSLKERDKRIRELEAGQLDAKGLLSQMSSELRALPRVAVQPYKFTGKKEYAEEDQILFLSDAHAGEVIDKAEIDGFNEYNFDIMCRRIWDLGRRVVQIKNLHNHAFPIKRLWVFSLGDLVTGEIHSMAETNEFPILSTIMQTAMVVAQFLIKLSAHYEEIQYVGVAGNHDRRHEKPRTKESYDNWAWILNWAVSLLCRDNPNIKFHVPKSPFVKVNIRGWNWLVRHGHGKTASFAGIPFYGISKKHSAFQELYRKRGGFDYEAMGHFHQQTVLKDDKVFINGSIIGANEFAVNELAAYSPPSQRLLGINDKRGVTYMYRLELEQDKEHGFVYDPDHVFEHKAHMASFINSHFDRRSRRR